MPGGRNNPIRPGYRFDGWYYDEWGNVGPIQEFEHGIQPGRHYFAGWKADPVEVRYHDTREGTGIIATQSYLYEDELSLIPNLQSTDGETFLGWKVATAWDADGNPTEFKRLTQAQLDKMCLANDIRYDPETRWFTDFNNGYLKVYGRKETANGQEVFDRMLSWTEITEELKVTAGATRDHDYHWVLDLYADWGHKTADFTATVSWQDWSDTDGVRPEAVTVGLRETRTNNTIRTARLTQADAVPGNENVWQHVFYDLDITTSDASVEEVTYSIYLLSYEDRMGNVVEIADTGSTNGEIGVAVKPDSISTPSMSSYTYGINNYSNILGEDATEDAIRSYAGKITLDHGLITTGTDIKFTIKWDDDSDRDGMRSGSVKLVLLANGSPFLNSIMHDKEYMSVVSVNEGMCEVSDDGNTWTYTFKDFQKYQNAGSPGEAIDYTVAVVNDGTDYSNWSIPYTANGYTATYMTGSQQTGDHAGVTLSRPVNRVDKTVTIRWEDQQNRDGYRPESVTVNLYAYGFNRQTESWEKWFVDSFEMTGGMTADTWAHTFTNLYERNGGKEITYLAEIGSELNALIPETANKYTWTNQELVITVSRPLDTKGVTAKVQWADTNNNDSLRPSSITLELYADGKPLPEAFGIAEADWKVVLSGDMTADEWTYTYEDLPVYTEGDSGRRIVYSLKVTEVKPGDLYGEYEERGVLGEPHTFTRYTAAYPREGNAEFTEAFEDSRQPIVRLTHELNQIEVPVSIIWRDSNNQDAQRPEYVNLALTAYQWNDETYKWEYVETATKVVRTDGINSMTASEWTDTFGLQYMYHDGVKIIYHLAVTSDLNEFLPEGSYEYGWTETAHGNQVDAAPQVTISQNVNTTSVTGAVFWDDSNNRDNIRPKNIVLQLYSHAPNRPEEKPEPVRGWAYRVNLSGDPKADNWTYTFTGMPKYDEGQSGIELVYTVRAVEAEGEPLYGYYIITANGGEEEVLRYEASYLHENREAGTTENTLDADLSDRAYVRLSHVCETKTMNLFANWHDGDNRDDMRPASVSVDLYKTVGNGEPTYLRTLVITEGSNGTWGYTVRDLPGYEDGQPVKYTIEVPEDVKAELEKAGYATTTEDNIVHLYHTPETGEISTRLYWSDGDDNDGYRPDSVVAALYANGAPTGRTADLNEGNGWSHTWTDLDVHRNQGAEHGIGTMGQQ